MRWRMRARTSLCSATCRRMYRPSLRLQTDVHGGQRHQTGQDMTGTAADLPRWRSTRHSWLRMLVC